MDYRITAISVSIMSRVHVWLGKKSLLTVLQNIFVAQVDNWLGSIVGKGVKGLESAQTWSIEDWRHQIRS